MEFNIAYSSSNAYAKCTGVSMLSLLHNNKDIELLTIYVFTTDMSAQNKNVLQGIAETFNKKLIIIDINQQMEHLAKQFKLESLRGGYNTYVRLFCSVWLDSLDRVLFLDSDTLVVDSIAKLYSLKMEDKLIAAVPDAGVYGRTACVENIDIVNKCSKYFNAGIVLINLKQWREDNINEYIAKKIQGYKKEWLNHEQSILNYTLYDRCIYVHLKYNYYTTFHYESYERIYTHTDVSRVFTKEEYEEAKKSPVIIHFVGLPYDRPWYKNSISPFKDVYIDYYSKSPWRTASLEKFPKNPQIGYRIYDYILFITQKHKLEKMHYFIKTVFGGKLKKILQPIVGRRK